MDASFQRSDWWQKVREHWHPAEEVADGEQEEEEEVYQEEDIEVDQECTPGAECANFSLTQPAVYSNVEAILCLYLLCPSLLSPANL